MKKIVSFLSLILIFMIAFLAKEQTSLVLAGESNKQYYAKVNKDEVYFFTQPNEASEFRLFKIPTSYFVLLTAEANDKFYSCSYGDKIGYVKKDDVLPMNGTPLSPYANTTTTRIIAPDGLDMRSSPVKNPLNIVARLNFLEDNILFYGMLDGDDFIPGNTKTWYYCKYINPTTSQIQFGYFYSYYCDQPNLSINMEEFPLIEGELFPVTPTKPQPSSSLSGTVKTLIIIGVSLPCVVILYLLIKPTLIAEHSNKKSKAKAKPKRRHGDYYEFDESDLN